MNRRQYMHRLDYLLNLVQKGALTSPHQIANRFECSEKTVRGLINDLRDEGHNIVYSRKLGRYMIH